MKYIYLLYLLISGTEDFRKRRVPLTVFILFSVIPLIKFLTGGGFSGFFGLIPGALLLILSFLTRDGIGKGDGIFFLVTGLYFSLGTVIKIILFSCPVVFICAAGLFIRERYFMKGNRGIPFISCLLPGFLYLFMEGVCIP